MTEPRPADDTADSPEELLVSEAADEYLERVQQGESPDVEDYVRRYPDVAEVLRDVLPALQAMHSSRATKMAAANESPTIDGILGDFRILREIGRGGMGIVYEAEQRTLARRVAVKILPKHLLLLDKHLQRFQHEAQTTARLRHTNIVPVFGVGEQDGLHYYVMPLIRGVGLDEVIRELRKTGDASMTGHGGGDSPSRREICDVVRALIDRRHDGHAPDRHGSVDGANRNVPRDRWRFAARVEAPLDRPRPGREIRGSRRVAGRREKLHQAKARFPIEKGREQELAGLRDRVRETVRRMGMAGIDICEPAAASRREVHGPDELPGNGVE